MSEYFIINLFSLSKNKNKKENNEGNIPANAWSNISMPMSRITSDCVAKLGSAGCNGKDVSLV